MLLSYNGQRFSDGRPIEVRSLVLSGCSLTMSTVVCVMWFFGGGWSCAAVPRFSGFIESRLVGLVDV